MIETLREKDHKEIFVYGSSTRVYSLTGRDKLSCAYLGPSGTYTQQAALELLDGQVEFEMAVRNGLVVTYVDAGKFDLGLVAVENSTEGPVLETMKEIIHSDTLVVLAERVLPIHHNLFGNIEILDSDSPVIHSHPQAFGQCSKWLEKHLPTARIEPEASTANAVRIALEKGELAIASAIAGRAYSVNPLYENIENFKWNTTRFWLLGHGETDPTGNDRTALLFSFRQGVGKIAHALTVFADRGISLNRIDSYPMGALDQYYFSATIDGHTKELHVAEAIEEFCKRCFKCKILGSYHKAPIQEKSFEPSAIQGGWAVDEDIDKV